ncbi:formin-like protein 11 [Bidens hawaiensis]|uniref:formin-like protein 11 n=1 Tax=Bidens hawaiensis TaxID=980011 RepID=UPI00404B00AC
MKCGSKIIIIIFLTTLIVSALYITQNLHVTPLKALVGFKNTKKPYFNLSPSPSPAPAPSPSLSQLSPSSPPRLHHVHRRNHHYLPPLVPQYDETDDERRLVVVAILVSACATTCMIFLIILFACFKALRARRKTNSSSKSMSMSMNTKMNMNTNKQDQLNYLENDEAKHKVITLRNILSNSENLDEEFGSDSYDDSFNYFYNSHNSSNSITSNVSVSCDMLLPSTSALPSSSHSGSNQTVTIFQPLPPTVTGKVGAAPDRSMVWDQLKSSLFDYNLRNANEELKSKSPSPGKHVLEPKRIQNLTMLFKALNATAEQVCCALIRGSGLNQQQLEVLIRMEPTKEEEAKITGYKGDLGSAEIFIATILTVPYAFQRIQALLYRETFEDEVTHLRTTFLVLEEACKELQSSRLLLKLLEAVFKMGNRMNVSTPKGGAKSFKLDTLLNLANIKGTDGKTTLLHFVVQEIARSEGVLASESIIGKINQKNKRKTIQDKEDDYRNMGLELVGGLSTELCNVKKAATIDFSVIVSTISNLSQGKARLRTLMKQDLSLGESMKSFLNYGVTKLKELHEDEHKMLELVKQMTEYFHGSMSKDDENPIRIFVIVRDFLVMLDRVCKELRRSKVFTHQNPVVACQ